MRGKYIILKLDFSALELEVSEDPKVVAKSFDDQFTQKIMSQVESCAERYKLNYTPPSTPNASGALRQLQRAMEQPQTSIPNQDDLPTGIQWRSCSYANFALQGHVWGDSVRN